MEFTIREAIHLRKATTNMTTGDLCFAWPLSCACLFCQPRLLEVMIAINLVRAQNQNKPHPIVTLSAARKQIAFSGKHIMESAMLIVHCAVNAGDWCSFPWFERTVWHIRLPAGNENILCRLLC